MTESAPKTCLACGKTLKGRIDKKFCDDYCRNNYNNTQKSKGSHSAYVRGITNTLLKNRKILEELLPAEKQTINYLQDKLIQKGFVFNYHTHTYTNKNGETYYYSFDYGYKKVENDWYMIVRRREKESKD